MRLLILPLLVCLSSCYSLPEAIAIRAAEVHDTCVPAADATVAALEALGYEATTVDGTVAGYGDSWHSWVMCSEDGHSVLLDPHALLGFVEIPANSGLARGYQQRVFRRFGVTRMPEQLTPEK